MKTNIPIYRAKSNERKDIYVTGFLIGVDEQTSLCTIRTEDDYIGGQICYLHTLSIHFEDMLDSQGNKIFASLQEDGKGGDIILEPYLETERETVLSYENYIKNIDKRHHTILYSKIIGIQQ